MLYVRNRLQKPRYLFYLNLMNLEIPFLDLQILIQIMDIVINYQ